MIVEKLPDRENKTLLEALKRVVSIYNTHGFYIQYILEDSEFRHMTDNILSTFNCHLNCTSAGEHVQEAERAVCVIKERMRCIITTWPYKSVPIVFKVDLMKFVIFGWIPFQEPIPSFLMYAVKASSLWAISRFQQTLSPSFW